MISSTAESMRLGVGEQLVALAGEAAEGEEPAGDGVAGGLVARHQQQGEEHQELVVLQGAVAVELAVARLLVLVEPALVEGPGEDADDVVGGRLAALRDQLEAHLGELAERDRGAVELGGVALVAVAGHHGVGPPVHPVAGGRVEAHHLADHDERDVGRHLLDEVDLAAVLDLVDDLVGQVADVGHQLADPAGGEAPVDQAPLAGVLGVVEGDERHVGGHLRPHALGRGPQVGPPGDVEDVGVAADDPQVVDLVAVQGRLVAQPAVRLPGVVVQLRGEDVDGRRDGRRDGRGRGGHGPILTPERSFGQGKRSFDEGRMSTAESGIGDVSLSHSWENVVSPAVPAGNTLAVVASAFPPGRVRIRREPTVPTS